MTPVTAKRWLPAAAVALLAGTALLTAPEPSAEAAWVSHGLRVETTHLGVLYPGRSQRMWVKVTNPYRFPIRVIRLQASITRTSPRGCSVRPANISLSAPHTSLPRRLHPDTRESVAWYELRMPPTAAQSCAGSHFRISVTAWATKDRS